MSRSHENASSYAYHTIWLRHAKDGNYYAALKHYNDMPFHEVPEDVFKRELTVTTCATRFDPVIDEFNLKYRLTGSDIRKITLDDIDHITFYPSYAIGVHGYFKEADDPRFVLHLTQSLVPDTEPVVEITLSGVPLSFSRKEERLERIVNKIDTSEYIFKDEKEDLSKMRSSCKIRIKKGNTWVEFPGIITYLKCQVFTPYSTQWGEEKPWYKYPEWDWYDKYHDEVDFELVSRRPRKSETRIERRLFNDGFAPMWYDIDEIERSEIIPVEVIGNEQWVIPDNRGHWNEQYEVEPEITLLAFKKNDGGYITITDEELWLNQHKYDFYIDRRDKYEKNDHQVYYINTSENQRCETRHMQEIAANAQEKPIIINKNTMKDKTLPQLVNFQMDFLLLDPDTREVNGFTTLTMKNVKQITFKGHLETKRMINDRTHAYQIDKLWTLRITVEFDDAYRLCETGFTSLYTVEFTYKNDDELVLCTTDSEYLKWFYLHLYTDNPVIREKIQHSDHPTVIDLNPDTYRRRQLEWYWLINIWYQGEDWRAEDQKNYLQRRHEQIGDDIYYESWLSRGIQPIFEQWLTQQYENSKIQKADA